MLTALRKQAGSWVVKALLLLLVLSFAIWGIGDIFYGNPTEETVASVGSSEITHGELNMAFDRSLSNLQRQFGGQLDRQQAIDIGLMQQTLQEHISRRLIDQEAAQMGVSVDDDTLRRLITENPAFQSAGRFDRMRFNQILYTTGLSEQGYLEVFRQELARNALTSSIAAAAAVPDAQVDAIYRYRNEERKGRYIKIGDADMTDIADPDDAALQAIHSENEQRFTAPEFRSITYVTLTPEDLLEEVEIPEEEVRASYEERSGRYTKAEVRAVQQLLAPDEETAAQAGALIEEGRDLAAIAEELDGVSLSDLGNVTENNMPAGIGAEAFTISEGEVTEPVQSPFGFHIFKVTSVEPEQVTPFEDVKDEIRDELALLEAEDRLPSLSTQLDDELAAGLGVREAAEAIGLKADIVDMIDRQGRDETGEPVESLQGWPGLLETAFDAFENEPSLLEETDEGYYYVVEVGRIEEPRLKALAEVRDDVVALYEDQQRRESARARAEDIRTRLQETADLETIAESEGLAIETIEPVKRSGDGAPEGVSPAAIQTLFSTDEGSIAESVVDVQDGVLIIANDEILEEDASANANARAQLKEELERQVRADLLDQYGRALESSYPIEIDQDALTRLIEYDPTVGYGGYGGGGMAPMGQHTGGMF